MIAALNTPVFSKQGFSTPLTKNIDKPTSGLANSVTACSPDVSNDNVLVRTHDEVLHNNALNRLAGIDFVERLLADAQIAKQSERIAYKLEKSGFNPYLSGENTISMVGLISGAIFGLSKYRNVNIIPEVAQRNRQPLLQQFDLFLKENPKIRRYARYMVVTSGPRFHLDQFPERLAAFNKQLGRYFAISTNAEIDVILCSIEFTVDEDRSINLHANIVSAPRKAFGPQGWSKWLDTTRSHFDGQMLHDAGRVKDTKEIIKYVCKYNEIAGLDGTSTAFIAETLHKKQMVRPLGHFREWRMKLKDNGQKVRFDSKAKSLVRCQVSKRKPVPGSAEEIQADILADAEEAERQQRRVMAARYERGNEKEEIENQILCKTLPQSRAMLLAEPFVVVSNFSSYPMTRNGRDGLEAINGRRAFHMKLLAEQGVECEDLDDAGVRSSKLDTLTIIPRQFISEFVRTSHERRQKLFKLLGFIRPEHDLDVVRDRVTQILQEHAPKTFHEWSIDVADPHKLLEKGREQQEAWEQRRKDDLLLLEEYGIYRERFEELTDDDLDDLIPYDLPVSTFVEQMRNDYISGAMQWKCNG